ncbi:MAG TPA: GNAT family N-acetyltransferase [Gaiellaceae bacterium]|nr:GNAT family N-acetyltransferase [Gaiellaceae bacterium]
MPAERLTIEPATRGDIEVLLGIQRAAAVTAFAHIFPPDRYPFPSAEIRDLWADALDDPEVETYLGLAGDEPAGLVSIGHGMLRRLFVAPERQGTGVGSELHDFGLTRLVALGESEARLWTLEGNASGRRFYERRGWVESGTTRVVPYPPRPLDVEYRRALP